MFNDVRFARVYSSRLENTEVPTIDLNAIHGRSTHSKCAPKRNWLPVLFGALLVPIAALAITQFHPRAGDVTIKVNGEQLLISHGSHPWFQPPKEAFKRMKAAHFHVVLPRELPKPFRLEGVLGTDNRTFMLMYAPFPFPTTSQGYKKQRGHSVELILQAASDPELADPKVGHKYSWVVGDERVTTYNPALTSSQIKAIKKAMESRI